MPDECRAEPEHPHLWGAPAGSRGHLEGQRRDPEFRAWQGGVPRALDRSEPEQRNALLLCARSAEGWGASVEFADVGGLRAVTVCLAGLMHRSRRRSLAE